MKTTTIPMKTQRNQVVPIDIYRAIDMGKTYARIDYTPTIEVDTLRLQACLNDAAHDESADLRSEFRRLAQQITDLAHGETIREEIKTSSPRKREAFVADQVRASRAARNALCRRKKSSMGKVSKLQKRQREIIKAVRKINGKIAVARRNAAAAKRQAESAALDAGRFWECSEATLKRFFRVPFDRRKLVSTSAEHRAALFLELTLGEGLYGYSALVPTRRAWLCGIDDNDEQWGFEVAADYKWDYDDTVEDAMALVWGVTAATVDTAHRQGELLVWPAELPHHTTLRDCRSYDLAPSHTAYSATMRANGSYLVAADTIVIDHPTHASLCLDPGSYRWATHDYDAD